MSLREDTSRTDDAITLAVIPVMYQQDRRQQHELY
ncbi:Uncharacterised protein [Kluyvera intermedia]|jgi:hypothetical protein|nr:Uncharacterised protein [Kluyvera intermedia]